MKYLMVKPQDMLLNSMDNTLMYTLHRVNNCWNVHGQCH